MPEQVVPGDSANTPLTEIVWWRLSIFTSPYFRWQIEIECDSCYVSGE